MKTRIFKLMAVIALLFTAIPMHSQNYLKIWFKDGHTERHFMHLVQNISATKYDLEGNLHSDYQMQQIVMPDTTYSYYIADIDSMSFRKVDEEQIVKDAVNVASIVESIYEQCGTIKDIEQHLDFLNTLEEVEYAYTTETDLVIQLRDSKKVFYHFIDANEEKRHEVNRRYTSKSSKQKTNGYIKTPTVNNNYNIAIAFQMLGDESWEDEKALLLSLKEDMKSLGFNVTFFGDEEDDQLFDITFYEDNIFDYDLVLLDTHGVYENNKHWLMSTEKFESYSEASEAIHRMYEYVLDIDDVIPRFHPIKQSNEKKTYYFPLISEDFFNRFDNSFKHSERANPHSPIFNPTIIFNGACESLKGNNFVYRNIDGEEKKYDVSTTMASVFLKRKNADLYLGYNESNSYCEKAYISILKDMLNGYSIKQAYNNLDLKYKNEKHQNFDATLLQFPENKNYCLVKTYTNQISLEELREELKHKNNVTIKGVTTIANRAESGIKYGFKYGTDKDLVDSTIDDATNIIEVDSPYGNVEFSFILEPRPGQKVYYQAFTYDGTYYNLADEICSFEVPDLALSTTAIELTAGETKTVEITSGSGNYAVETSDPNVAQAEENDGVVTIIGRRPSAEPAIITVTDNVTKQTATISVTVKSTPDFATGEPIDLGLPSGTLWASCNVGASSPEEYGNYYAWGETETKEEFNTITYQFYDSSSETFKHIGYNISGTDYDVAHVKWGGMWRMPSMADYEELRNTCTAKWTVLNGVVVKQYTGPSGKSIYLPATGYYSGTTLNEEDTWGAFWLADLYPEDEDCAYLIISEDNNDNTRYHGGRSLGVTVRPVQKTTITEEERIKQVVPEEYLEKLKEHITIYKGNNPPNIEGEYLISPCTMTYDSDGDYEEGHVFTPKQLKLNNQNILNNTISYQEKQGSSIGTGTGSFISGEGDNFSVFFNIENMSHYDSYDVNWRRAMIVSGTKTSEGLKDLVYAFIITSKSDDPQNEVMNVGDYRVIKDGDGIAENFLWDSDVPSGSRQNENGAMLKSEASKDANKIGTKRTSDSGSARSIRID